jgi:hypothetical protein
MQDDEWIDDDIEPPKSWYRTVNTYDTRWCERCNAHVARFEWRAHLVCHDHAYAGAKELPFMELNDEMKRKLDRLIRDVVGPKLKGTNPKEG